MVAVSLKKFFFQAEDGIRDHCVTGVQTCALPISPMYTFFDPQTGTSGLKTGKDILRIYDVQGLK